MGYNYVPASPGFYHYALPMVNNRDPEKIAINIPMTILDHIAEVKPEKPRAKGAIIAITPIIPATQYSHRCLSAWALSITDTTRVARPTTKLVHNATPFVLYPRKKGARAKSKPNIPVIQYIYFHLLSTPDIFS
jgi:hypothetical protein